MRERRDREVVSVGCGEDGPLVVPMEYTANVDEFSLWFFSHLEGTGDPRIGVNRTI